MTQEKKDYQEKKSHKDKDNSKNNPQNPAHNKDKKGGCGDCTF